MTLLVATQDPNAIAETYVRHHMRSIAPGKTVGLGFALKGDPPADFPFLSMQLPDQAIRRKLFLLRGKLFHNFSGSPVGSERDRLITFIRRHGVKLVLAEFGPTGAALREICRTENIPLVVNFHGYDATVMPKRGAIRSAYKSLARDAAGIVCGSKCFRKTVSTLGFPLENIKVIPCGVQTDKFHASPNRAGKKLIAVGRLTPKKAPVLTLRAFAEALSFDPTLSLDLIGDGPLRPECEHFVAKHGLGHCVRLWGACNHETVRAALAEADIFLQHSVVAPNGDTESQGISLVEAMAAQLPVVATDHNGFSETVLHGETGFLVQEGDWRDMGRRILHLVQTRDAREAMGQAGQRRAQTLFDEKIVMQDLRKYLLDIADFR